jgi:hypothetical protein
MTFRACIVKWVTENSRPVFIVKDAEHQTLVIAGWLNAIIPSPLTVKRDVNTSFVKCCEKVAKLLKVRANMSIFPGAINHL